MLKLVARMVLVPSGLFDIASTCLRLIFPQTCSDKFALKIWVAWWKELLFLEGTSDFSATVRIRVVNYRDSATRLQLGGLGVWDRESFQCTFCWLQKMDT